MHTRSATVAAMSTPAPPPPDLAKDAAAAAAAAADAVVKIETLVADLRGRLETVEAALAAARAASASCPWCTVQ